MLICTISLYSVKYARPKTGMNVPQKASILHTEAKRTDFLTRLSVVPQAGMHAFTLYKPDF
jgi:hypothetical protein